MESLPHWIRQKQKKKNIAKGAKLINKDFNLNYKLKKENSLSLMMVILGQAFEKLGDIFSKGNIT